MGHVGSGAVIGRGPEFIAARLSSPRMRSRLIHAWPCSKHPKVGAGRLVGGCRVCVGVVVAVFIAMAEGMLMLIAMIVAGLAGTVRMSTLGMRRWDGAYAVRTIGGAGVEWLLRGSDRGDGETREAKESG